MPDACRSSFLNLMSAVLALAALNACAEEGQTTPPAPKPAVQIPEWVCGSEYENHAWGYVRNGTVIDGKGRVLSYETPRSQPPPPPHEGDFTPAQLAERYAGATPRTYTVSQDELQQIVPLIAEAAKTEMSEGKHEAYDAGSSTLYCLLFDPQAGTYREVALATGGDFSSARESASAKELTERVRKILVASAPKPQ
jgi:hypothetical protein